MKFSTKKLCPAIFSSLILCACSSTDTAGVISETESGQTLAVSGKFTDSKAQAVEGATVALVNPHHVAARSNPLYTTTTDDNGEYRFENVEAGEYNLVVNDTVNHLAQMEPIEIKDSSLFHESTLSLAATIVVDDTSLGTDSSTHFETICIVGTLNCATINSDGVFELKDIPPGDFNQFAIVSSESEEVVDYSVHVKPGEQKDLTFKEPLTLTMSQALADSISSLKGEMVLDSLIIPASRFDVDLTEKILVDSNVNEIPSFKNDKGTLALVIPAVHATGDTIYLKDNRTANEDTKPSARRIREFIPQNSVARSIEGPIFVDSSMAFSFAFSFSREDEDSSEIVLAESKTDGIGFEIRSCAEDLQNICVKIYNGVDSANTDSTNFLKANLLDGKEHHIAMAIHKKHLNITVDGVSRRDTDLKLSDDFYKLKNLTLGDFTIKDFTYFSFGDFIRHKEDKDWERMKIWLQAHYSLGMMIND